MASFSLFEPHPVLLGNVVQLLSSELPQWCSRSAGHLTKERLESRRCDNPKQQQLAVGILNSMPSVLGNVDRRALFDGHSCVVQYAETSAFQHEQHLVCFFMLMDSDAGPDRNLLRSQGHVVRTPGRVNLDENTSGVPNELFALRRA